MVISNDPMKVVYFGINVWILEFKIGAKWMVVILMTADLTNCSLVLIIFIGVFGYWSPSISASTIRQPVPLGVIQLLINQRYPIDFVTVSNYTNFKGNKKRVWYLYFIESDECLSNKNDMKIFVVCGKVRKQNLKTFSARWNNQTQELMPFLDN